MRLETMMWAWSSTWCRFNCHKCWNVCRKG